LSWVTHVDYVDLDLVALPERVSCPLVVVVVHFQHVHNLLVLQLREFLPELQGHLVALLVPLSGFLLLLLSLQFTLSLLLLLDLELPLLLFLQVCLHALLLAIFFGVEQILLGRLQFLTATALFVKTLLASRLDFII
jgi:hypothetical protein